MCGIKGYVKICICVLSMVALMGMSVLADETGLDNSAAEPGNSAQTGIQEGVADVSGGDAVPAAPAEVPDVNTGNGQAGASGNDLTGTDSINGSLEGNSLVVQPEEEVKEENKVIAIRVPKNLNFVLDPWNLCGRGMVWSESYSFRNNGETAVRLSLENIKCVLKSGAIAAGAEDNEETIMNSTEKLIRMELYLGNGDVLNVTEGGCGYEAVLAPGEELTFYVGGCISRNSANSWQSGDVSLKMMYNVQIADENE